MSGTLPHAAASPSVYRIFGDSVSRPFHLVHVPPACQVPSKEQISWQGVFVVIFRNPLVLLTYDLLVIVAGPARYRRRSKSSGGPGRSVIYPSEPPKTMTYTIANGMSGIPSPPAPARSRGAHRVDLTLRRGTATTTIILIGWVLTGRSASTMVGGYLMGFRERGLHSLHPRHHFF